MKYIINDAEELKQWLKASRKDENLSQTGLAEKSLVSRHTIELIEKGKSNPCLETMLDLCAVLGYRIVLESEAEE